jgi:glycosyltransferase involved in cell wall biosynthesis
MRAAVVVPCLNEQATLEQTCASLGFGHGTHRAGSNDVSLILVDNGSEDDTWLIMERVQQNSPPGSVVLTKEPVRGYVPPRHRGVLEARSIARASNTAEDDFLIVQADADTTYCEGYVAYMMRTAAAHRGDCIIEAISRPPPAFSSTYPAYGRWCESTDSTMQHLWVSEEDDIVVDDKICAYTLKDYVSWGGHRREFASNGDEIHAETTRLYIKARLNGAHRARADKAVAWPSRRKLEQNPVLYFATVGFPREHTWRQRWHTATGAEPGLQDFVDQSSGEVARKAALLRKAHALILFGLLPAYVAKLMGLRTCQEQIAEFSDLLPALSPLTRADIVSNTAILFERGFSLMDTHWPLLERHVSVRSASHWLSPKLDHSSKSRETDN